jgi:hypothetical protein
MSMPMVFWVCVGVSAAVGSLRGWAKELLVGLGLVLALFINLLLDKYAQGVLQTLAPAGLFGVKAGVFALLAYFAYLTPRLPFLPDHQFLREHLQDWLLGALLGAVNGAFLAGSIWFFLHKAGYPFVGLEAARASATNPEITNMIQYMPPMMLTEMWVYIAVAAAFVFVIVVFV